MPENVLIIESWRAVFREGFAPALSTAGLEALAKALREDDEKVQQCGTTVVGWGFDPAKNEPVCCCPIAYAIWKGEDVQTAEDVDIAFDQVCKEAGDESVLFIRWVDSVPREQMLDQLLPEVESVLAERKKEVPSHSS